MQFTGFNWCIHMTMLPFHNTEMRKGTQKTCHSKLAEAKVNPNLKGHK